MKQLVGYLHAGRPAEGQGLRFVDASGPVGDSVLARECLQQVLDAVGGRVVGKVAPPPGGVLPDVPPPVQYALVLRGGQRRGQDGGGDVLGCGGVGELDGVLPPAGHWHSTSSRQGMGDGGGEQAGVPGSG